MANTVYVITGGNRGIGLGLVKLFISRADTTVITTVRNQHAVASLEGEDIQPGSGSRLHVAILDLTRAVEPAKVLEAIEGVTADHPVDHVDVLINNAAYCPELTAAVVTTAEDMRATYETNTIAPLLIFQALLPLLQKSPSGSPKVFNITSTVGGISQQEPLPGGAYGPSKAALNWVTKALHLQHEKDGIVAVALHPGWVQTRAGDIAAKSWKYDAGPPTTLESSVTEMARVIDGATRETAGGEFLRQNGEKWFF